MNTDEAKGMEIIDEFEAIIIEAEEACILLLAVLLIWREGPPTLFISRDLDSLNKDNPNPPSPPYQGGIRRRCQGEWRNNGT